MKTKAIHAAKYTATVGLLAALLWVLPAIADCPPLHPPTPTPYPPQATYTPRPTYTALPTYTAGPTETCQPTYTPIVRPTYTPLPTSTAYPTQTPYPTPGAATATPTPTATATPLPSSGTVYYLSPDGSDGNPGTHDRPFATLTKGLATAQNGDTLHILAGTYDLGAKSYTLSRRIVLEGDGETSILTNGKRLTITTGVTIRDLAFVDFAHSAYGDAVLVFGQGATLDGLTVERVLFQDVYGGISGRHFDGSLHDATIADCTFHNIVSSEKAFAINIDSELPMSRVLITRNTFTHIATTKPTQDTIVIYIGTTVNRNADYITVSHNVIHDVIGGTESIGSYTPGGRAILVYGSYNTIAYNEIQNVNQAVAHNGIYAKGSHLRIIGNYIHRGGSTNVGSGDLCIKGEGNVDNEIRDNTILSDDPAGGIPIFTRGEVIIDNNHVQHASARYGIYSYELPGRNIDVTNNHIEVLGRALHISGDPASGEIAYNTFISHVGYPAGTLKTLDGNVSYHDNQECIGYDCKEE